MLELIVSVLPSDWFSLPGSVVDLGFVYTDAVSN